MYRSSSAVAWSRSAVLPLPFSPKTIAVEGRWEGVLAVPARAALEAALRAHLVHQQFGGDPRNARYAELSDVVPVPGTSPAAYLTLVHVELFEGEAVDYLMPLSFVAGAGADGSVAGGPLSVDCAMKCTR